VLAQEDFEQLKLRFVDPIQHDYEAIRDIVLFAETASARSLQTGMERTVLRDKARRFIEDGMLGLADRRPGSAGRKGHVYPEPIAAYILYLKQLHPPIHLREIERILQRKFAYHTNHHTLKRFLERHASPVQLELNLTFFADFADAYQARWTVVRMAYEGWNQTSIAGCLKLSRRHVYNILKVFKKDGFAGLEDQRTRPFPHPGDQLSLPFFKDVLDLQREYRRAGRFRLYGLLEQQSDEPPPSERTVGRAMAVNRRLHGAPGPWRSARDDKAEEEEEAKSLPYRPQYRHHLWFADIRYLVELDGNWVYSICIIEGYSRKILAGMASLHQDLVAVLQILFAALSTYGCPSGMVSDHGSVFTAGDYLSILRALEIKPLHIEKGKPWQNLIESQFKIQLRLADFKFEQAQSLEEIQNHHAAFIETFNTTRHWAHREREDGKRRPVEVLGWVKGRVVQAARLHQLFDRVAFVRRVNRYGFVSVQRFYIYAEDGLSRKRVSIWIYEGQLRIEYEQTLLARYRCMYNPRQGRIEEVSDPTLYTTAFVSKQIELFELDDEQWKKVQQRPMRPYSGRRIMLPEQLLLIDLSASALSLLALKAI
jgi:transposase InsO family protein